jgi:hypothetical protein
MILGGKFDSHRPLRNRIRFSPAKKTFFFPQHTLSRVQIVGLEVEKRQGPLVHVFCRVIFRIHCHVAHFRQNMMWLQQQLVLEVTMTDSHLSVELSA